VVIEIDGRYHNYIKDYDSARDAYLESIGLTVIHLSARRVLQETEEVMDFLFDHPAFAIDSLG
jgi:very-short-patch-repair endonuclease